MVDDDVIRGAYLPIDVADLVVRYIQEDYELFRKMSPLFPEDVHDAHRLADAAVMAKAGLPVPEDMLQDAYDAASRVYVESEVPRRTADFKRISEEIKRALDSVEDHKMTIGQHLPPVPEDPEWPTPNTNAELDTLIRRMSPTMARYAALALVMTLRDRAASSAPGAHLRPEHVPVLEAAIDAADKVLKTGKPFEFVFRSGDLPLDNIIHRLSVAMESEQPVQVLRQMFFGELGVGFGVANLPELWAAWWRKYRAMAGPGMSEEERIVEEAGRYKLIGKRPTLKQAEQFARWYFRAIRGFTENRWGSLDTPAGKRLKFTKRTIQELKKVNNRWVKVDSISPIDFVEGLISNAVGFAGTEEMEVKVEKRRERKKVAKKKAKAKRVAKAQQEAAHVYAWKAVELDPEVRGVVKHLALAGTEDDWRMAERVMQEARAREDYLLEELKTGRIKEIPDRDDGIVSLENPPYLPLVPPGLLPTRPAKLIYRWVEDGVPVRIAQERDLYPKVTIGVPDFLSVDPTSLSIEMADRFWTEEEVDFEDALISGVVVCLPSVAKLGARLSMIAVKDKRRGTGTRLLRQWCRLLGGYDTRMFVTTQVGEEGEALFQALHDRGDLHTHWDDGKLIVTCDFSSTRKLFI